MLVSELLEIVKLILTVLATNAISGKLNSTLHRLKFYLRSSTTKKLFSSILINATYKEKVDKLKLFQVESQFLSKMSIIFPFKNRYFPRAFIESASQDDQLWPVEIVAFYAYFLIYLSISLYIYIWYICINFICHVQMSKYIFKKPRHLFSKKLYFGFFQTFKDSIK